MSPLSLRQTLGAVLAAGLLGPVVAPVAAQLSPTAPAVGPSPEAVLLLANGKIQFHKGGIVEDDDSVTLTKPIGSIRLRRRDVEGVFGSLAEVYEYKKTRLPDRDPDEHMRLAQWCLSFKLKAQAAEQLRAVLAWSPGDRQATGMLASLEAASQRDAAPTFDPAIARTGATVDGVAPRELDSEALMTLRRGEQERRQRRESAGAPVVFDLPAPLAARRYQEFARVVHPQLQRLCAGCHDENSGRAFTIVRARAPKDLANDLLVRTNLDATLRLVNPADTSRSELLLSAVMPHAPQDRPILSGPNHPTYRMLAAWVGSMKATATVEPPPSVDATPASYPVPPRAGSGFASERNGRGVGPVGPPPADLPMPIASGPTVGLGQPGSGSTVETHRGNASHPAVPANAEFRTPDMMVDKPAVPTRRGALPALPQPPAQPLPAGATVETLADGTKMIRQVDGSKAIQLPDGTLAPIVDLDAPPPPAAAEAKGGRRKIDPALLQKMLNKRPGG